MFFVFVTFSFFFAFLHVWVTLIKFLPLRNFSSIRCDFFPCEFFPQLLTDCALDQFSSFSPDQVSEGVDAPVQSIRPQHFCFARTELIPPQIWVQALSTSFEKTCKSRLRGEFFQDVVLATYPGLQALLLRYPSLSIEFKPGRV